MNKISRRTVLATAATLMVAPKTSLARTASSRQGDVLDVAIIGAGVAGCYAAWRISAQKQGQNIGVFERNNRIGGRLWSVKPKGMTQQVAELGGMRIAANQTPLLNLTRVLKLSLEPYPSTEPINLYYLRGIRTRAKDLACSPKFGYRPLKKFEGKTSDALFKIVLQELTGSINWTRESFEAARSGFTFQGKPLNTLPFEYVFQQILGSEASRFFLDTTGYGWPNMNVIQFLEEGAIYLFLKDYKHVKGGYDLVPKGLAKEAKSQGVTFTLGRTLRNLQFDGDLTVLTFADEEGEPYEVRAKSVISTLPDTAYNKLDYSCALRNSDAIHMLNKNLLGVDVARAYVNFPSQWWRDLDMTEGRSITDLPLRQSFYLNDPSGRGLTLSPYASGENAEGFWKPLLQPSTEHRMRGDTLAGKAIVDQINVLHGIKVPLPTELIYRIFDGGYTGHGWNMWAPSVDISSIIANVQQPIQDRSVYCCGQGAAASQGWVMDTLVSVESVMRNKFNLARPEWWPASYSVT